ncbi:MAG: alpha-hydroxy acid oxidase [Trebonia sp.]
MPGPVNLFEFEDLARDKLEPGHYDYIAGGAADEITLRRARTVYDTISLRPRALAGVDSADLATTALGQRISMPVMLAPTGFHHRAHPDAEFASARAASAAGTVMVVSSASSFTLEEIRKNSSECMWFQQYLYQDRSLTLRMAERAKEAGYQALCITLDAATRAKRERNIRNSYANPPSPNYRDVELAAETWDTSADEPRGMIGLINRKATWAEFEWLAGHTSLPLVGKGIMTPEDARLCADSGARGLIVSNHGARQLDTTPTTIEVLPEVAAEVGGQAEIYLDGGIRRGTDVLKALALGAHAVLLGRPVLWGLAADGEAGVRATLEILRHELSIAMVMCGQSAVTSLGDGIVARRRSED